MPEINVSRLINDVDAHELSGSVAERGVNAGRETWQNAMDCATVPLEPNEDDAIRAFFRGFGAWEAEEIAGWSQTKLHALVLQFAAGDLRELQDLCPGDGLADVNWTEAERLANEGTVGGRLFPLKGQLFIYIGD